MSSQYTYKTEWEYVDEAGCFMRSVLGSDGVWYQERNTSFTHPRTQPPVDVSAVTNQLSETSLDTGGYGTSPSGGSVYTTDVYSSSAPASKGKGKAKDEPKSSSHKHHSSSKESSSKSKHTPVASSSKSKYSESRDTGKRRHKDDKYDSAPDDPFYAGPASSTVSYSYGKTSAEGPGQAQPIDPTYGYAQAGYDKAEPSETTGGKSHKKGDQIEQAGEANESLSGITPGVTLSPSYTATSGGYSTSSVAGYPAVAQTSYSYTSGSNLPPIAELDADPYRGGGQQQYSGSYAYAPLSPGAESKHPAASSSKKGGRRDWSSALPEVIDPRYVVEPSRKFALGQVFKILWSEPRGQTTREDIDRMTEKAKVKTGFGDEFYISFRRYIVAREDAGHSICVPILTYEGKGCSKRGVKPEKHGIIYDRRDTPKLAKGEPNLGFKPLKMVSTASDERLAKESRINYSKPMSIEHNVKVFFIGYIPEEDLDSFQSAIEKAWAPKKSKR